MRLTWKELRGLIKKTYSIAEELLLSYLKAEFFTKPPDIPEEIEVVTYVAGVGDISTDFYPTRRLVHILD